MSCALRPSQTIGQYLFPGMLSKFFRNHGTVQVVSKGGNTDEVLQRLVDGEVDVALIEGPSTRTDVQSTAFLEDQMVLVVPPTHPWAGLAISLQQLESQPMVSRELGSGSRRVVEAALRQAGLPEKALRYAFTFDSTEGLLSAVEAGLGVAFVSRWAIRNQLALGTLRKNSGAGSAACENLFGSTPFRTCAEGKCRSVLPISALPCGRCCAAKQHRH